MIFVDTGFFFALVSANDPDHEGVVEVLESLKAQKLPELLLTTNHVVFETITTSSVSAPGTCSSIQRESPIGWSVKTFSPSFFV